MRRLVVDTAAFRANVEAVISAVAPTPVIGVCKADGMGLGALRYAAELLGRGVSMLAVATVEEGEILRQGGIDCPILMLSSTSLRSEVRRILELGLIPTVGSVSAADALAGSGAKVHVKVDSGFGRYGFYEGEEGLCASALEAAGLEAVGIFTHFSSSFSSGPVTGEQLAAFTRFADRLAALGHAAPMRHAANSCGALLHPDARLDAVRIGSAFLGRLPVPVPVGLTRIGWLEADLAELHSLPKGHNVGYTNVFKTRRPTRSAVVTAGLADGIGLSRGKDAFRPYDHARYIKRALVDALRPPVVSCLINGSPARTMGRIGLTSVVVDVTGLACAVGDIARFEINPLMTGAATPREWR